MATLECIAHATPTSTTVVTFDSISQDYEHLIFKAMARADNATTGLSDTVSLKINNSGSSSYYDIIQTQQGYGPNSYTATLYDAGANQSIGFWYYAHVPGGGNDAGVMGIYECHIYRYTDTTKGKLGIWHTYTNGGNSATTSYAAWGYGATCQADYTDAVTRLDFAMSSSNFATGSMATLYGLRG